MQAGLLAKRSIALALSIALLAPAQVFAQVKRNYASFDACFREQRLVATAAGGVVGGTIGKKIADAFRLKGAEKTATTAAAAVVGGLIGNRIAWNVCLNSFPVKSRTESLGEQAVAGNQSIDPAASRTNILAIESVNADTLTFGKDLAVTVTYRYIANKADLRDIKAKISRNLVFIGPDEKPQEVTSTTEDIIQQGVSRATFAMPTPSIAEAPELKSTKGWAVKFVVDVDGMHQEQTTVLSVPELSPADNAGIRGTTAGMANADPKMSSASGKGMESGLAAPSTEGSPTSPLETVKLNRGAVLYRTINSSAVVTRTPIAVSAVVLERSVEGSIGWMRVRLADGTEGWIKGGAR